MRGEDGREHGRGSRGLELRGGLALVAAGTICLCVPPRLAPDETSRELAIREKDAAGDGEKVRSSRSQIALLLDLSLNAAFSSAFPFRCISEQRLLAWLSPQQPGASPSPAQLSGDRQRPTAPRRLLSKLPILSTSTGAS